jgi:hypothetical protein
MTASDKYSSPAAFRRALTDRIRQAAKAGRWTMPQLQRQVAYDRLLARLYQADDSWVLKGATALLARALGTRGTLDIDLYRETARGTAEADFRHAAAADIGDWFHFEVGGGSPVGTGGTRLPVTALIGPTAWAQFHVDLIIADLQMTGQPEEVMPLAKDAIPAVTQQRYRAYPLTDHIADKVAATYERYGQAHLPSTRYRDLVDLVSIAKGASVPADGLLTALTSEFQRRQLPLPASFDVPDRRLWETGYSAEARRSSLTSDRTLTEALATARGFLDPVLAGTAYGKWDSRCQQWQEPGDTTSSEGELPATSGAITRSVLSRPRCTRLG